MAKDYPCTEEELQAEAAQLYEVFYNHALDEFNSVQLWYIYLGLSRLALASPLAEGVASLVERIAEHGRNNHDWVI